MQHDLFNNHSHHDIMESDGGLHDLKVAEYVQKILPIIWIHFGPFIEKLTLKDYLNIRLGKDLMQEERHNLGHLVFRY